MIMRRILFLLASLLMLTLSVGCGRSHLNVGPPITRDSGTDTGIDSGRDSGFDSGRDTGMDAPPGFCGDRTCDGASGETCASCEADCGRCTACGDGMCADGETCASCATDCGICDSCGDGACNSGESCGSCPRRCELHGRRELHELS